MRQVEICDTRPAQPRLRSVRLKCATPTFATNAHKHRDDKMCSDEWLWLHFPKSGGVTIAVTLAAGFSDREIRADELRLHDACPTWAKVEERIHGSLLIE